MNYYERHIGDYLKDTAHLSLLEHGVYSRLLDVYYTREIGIGAKEVERLIGAKSKDERAALGVVLAEFFVLDGDIWKQRRCDLEIARYQEKQRKASASANARWNKPAAHTERNADAMRTHSEGNAPSNQTPDTRHASNDACSGAAPKAPAPPPPLPDFDGSNAPLFNGKHLAAIAVGFDLPEEWGVDAEALGWKRADVLKEAEKFRQYWARGKGQGTRRSVKGWRQSWSTWLEKAARNIR